MIDSSREIIERAIADYQPYAIVSMISGGKDSLCAYLVAKQLGVPVTHILHGVTGTGIPETTEFVRQFAQGESPTYLESNAGSHYEDYVLRKGFFGKGLQAHSFAYHLLKHSRFSKCISVNIRHRKRGRNIILLNGARASESLNRSRNMTTPVRHDPSTTSNIWVNICHDWSQQDRDAYLAEVDAPVNPVTTKLCRSGECLCGTTQSQATRQEAAFYYPKWGAWLDGLEAEVKQRFPWGWGEAMSGDRKQETAGQLPMFQPMCVGCVADLQAGESG